MKKKHLPLEKDVDIEFEYKIYMLLDYIKKYHKILLGLAIAILIAVTAFFYYKKEKEKTYNQASAIVYQIGDLYAQEKYDEALKLIKNFKQQFSNTPYIKLALSYELLILKAKKEKLDYQKTITKELQQKLKTKHLKSAFIEYDGYLSYAMDKPQESIQTLSKIKKDHFNYISAQLLKAFAYKKLGKEKEAKTLFEEISQTSTYQYFKLVARENL
ncbi:MAG: tetratricopeptide repeat protein [Aquificae bacterium]|nr:tetratricopeptide repeat protein [Aquificota bacterium]